MVDDDIIVPPANIRSLVEKTASAVGKRPALEAKILEGKAADPRFAFLLSSNPYHAFYRAKVAEASDETPGARLGNQPNGTEIPVEPPARIGPSPDRGAGEQSLTGDKPIGSVKGSNSAEFVDTAKRVNSVPPVENGSHQRDTVQQVAAAVSKLKAARLKADSERPVPTSPPLDNSYSVPNVSPAVDNLSLDVIKLAAQYAAHAGTSFVEMLSRKEQRNPLFDFLNPVHPHFFVFQRMTAAYRAVLRDRNTTSGVVAELGKDVSSREAVLQKMWYRHDWRRAQESKATDEAEMSSFSARAVIDWHDFVVLETIDIGENDVDLPAPLADPTQIPRVMAAAEAARRELEMNRQDVDMDMDGDIEIDEEAHGSMTNAYQSATIVTADVDADIPSNQVRKHQESVGDSRIGRSEHVPAIGQGEPGVGPGRSMRPPSGLARGQEVLLPDGQVVPVAEATPAMHAQLLDPKYKEERMRAAEKNQRYNLAGGEEMALQLARLNRDKPDSGVYNRGDLQGSLAAQHGIQPPLPVELPQPKTSGPQLPSTKQIGGDESESQPAKRARIEAAVGTLTQAASAGKTLRKEGEPPVPGADPDGLPLPPAPVAPAGLVPEMEWIAKVGKTVSIHIKAPVHANRNWKLEGQEINMEVPLRSTVHRLKEVLARAECTAVPGNRQKLQFQGIFMNNRHSLAFYNIGPGSTIQLEVKERGGKKK